MLFQGSREGHNWLDGDKSTNKSLPFLGFIANVSMGCEAVDL